MNAAFNSLSKPLIVRSSHPNDWEGYIDVLPTIRGVTSVEELVYAIDLIKAVAASEELAIHAEDWGQLHSPEVHILLQEQARSSLIGSMVRHPHTQGIIYINHINIEERLRDRYTDWQLAVSNEGIIHDYSQSGMKQALTHAVRVYEEVENYGILDEEYVYQMEMGLDPIQVFQLRPFKKRENTAHFSLPKIQEDCPHIYSSLVFGITPEEGIPIDFISSFGEPDSMNVTIPMDHEYGLLVYGKVMASSPPELRMRKMKAYVTPTSLDSILNHGDYRHLKRAEFAMNYAPTNLIRDNIVLFSQSQMWSNGHAGIIVPRQYVG